MPERQTTQPALFTSIATLFFVLGALFGNSQSVAAQSPTSGYIQSAQNNYRPPPPPKRPKAVQQRTQPKAAAPGRGAKAAKPPPRPSKAKAAPRSGSGAKVATPKRPSSANPSLRKEKIDNKIRIRDQNRLITKMRQEQKSKALKSSAIKNKIKTKPLSVNINRLPRDVQREIGRIRTTLNNGGNFPFKKDNKTYANKNGALPHGKYKEFTVRTPGVNDRGSRRIVIEQNSKRMYYTNDHYRSFKEVL